MKTLGTILLRGLVVIVPLAVTLYLLWWLGASAERLLGPIIRAVLPAEGPTRYRTGMGVVAGLAAVLAIGVLTRVVMFRHIVAVISKLMHRIPLVRSVYGGLRDLMDLMSRTSDQKTSLHEVVSVELQPGMRLLGFISQPDRSRIPASLQAQDDVVAVYLPMSYQLGGYTLVTPREKITTVDMSIEEAMRFALTAGMSRDGNVGSAYQFDKKGQTDEEGLHSREDERS